MTDPLIKRGSVSTRVGVEVDSLSISLMCNEAVQYANIPLTLFALRGGFDGARVEVSRNFAAAWGQESCGSLHIFSGRVADVNISGTEIAMEVKSDLELLNMNMPRNIYMAQCIHTLYSANCGAKSASFTVSANVTANSTTTSINTDLSQATGYFDLGVIEFTSGQNLGQIRTVKSYANGVVSSSYPLAYAPTANDTFTIKPGCDKLQTTCNARFSNYANFRAFRFIPVPEVSY